MKRSNSSRRRIVFHSENGPLIGGSDYYLGHIIDGLDPEQWEVYVMARPNYPLARISTNSHRITHLPFGPELKRFSSEERANGEAAERPVHLPCRPRMLNQLWAKAPRAIRRDVGLIRDTKRVCQILSPIAPDIVHSVDGGPQPVVLGAARTGAQVVLGYSAPPPDKQNRGMCRWIESRACQLASFRITKSEYARQDWAGYLGCSIDQFQVIANGIEPERFTDTPTVQAKQQLGLPLDQLIIGTTARLETEKGVDVFLQAAKILAQSDDKLHFVITGDGSLAVELQASIDRSNLRERITMLGHRDDIPTVTAAYDIAVIPSVWNEPFGWVVLEAMAAKKPVIASRVGGIPEIVEDRRTGLLIKPNSSTDLIAAIHDLKNAPELRDAMGALGLNRVIDRFSRVEMIRQTTALYEQLCLRTAKPKQNANRMMGETVPCGPQ